MQRVESNRRTADDFPGDGGAVAGAHFVEKEKS
jgi:hypothetical protein